ncbi:MAG: hypothetical protein AB8B74_05010 [Crocinitomicaceae bacterium]
MTRFLFISFFMLMLYPLTVLCQSVNPKGSLFVDVTIPTNERNRAFDRTMEGLFHGGIGYQYNVFKGLTVGAGASYSFFVTNRVEFNSTIGTGGTHLAGGHVRLGFERFTTDRVSIYSGVKAGFANIIVFSDSNTVKLNGPFQVGSFFLSPQIEVNVLTETGSPSAFSFIVGYSWYFKEYNASFMSRQFFPGYIDELSQGYIRFLNLGFGYKHYFGNNL